MMLNRVRLFADHGKKSSVIRVSWRGRSTWDRLGLETKGIPPINALIRAHASGPQRELLNSQIAVCRSCAGLKRSRGRLWLVQVWHVLSSPGLRGSTDISADFLMWSDDINYATCTSAVCIPIGRCHVDPMILL